MYDELYEAWRKERESAEVQLLPKDFFVRLALYVKRLREEGRMLDEKSIRARLLLRESRYVRKLVGELIHLRYGKVLRRVVAGEGVVREGLTDDEVKLFGGMTSSTEAFRDFLKGVLGGRSLSVEVKKETRKSVLRFLRGVPAVVGVDMRVYGPFRAEDVGSVPVGNARVFVRQGLAVEVEVRV